MSERSDRSTIFKDPLGDYYGVVLSADYIVQDASVSMRSAILLRQESKKYLVWRCAGGLALSWGWHLGTLGGTLMSKGYFHWKNKI